METRREKDFLGERDVPAGAYYGIHSLRASENFPLTGRALPALLIKALALIKKAAAGASKSTGDLTEAVANPIVAAATEVAAGTFNREFIVDPLQGGAGTASNMNANEVIANRANELLGKPLGAYSPIHPIDQVNLGQSTNDVFPSAIRIAAIWSLRELVDQVAFLQEELQKKETEFAGILKIGRTQLQDAVPLTLGAEFSCYAEALSRDRWRLSRLEERLRVINIGGTAIGTGITVNRRFQNALVNLLRDETGIGLARAENLVEATQNADVFVETSGLLKPLAVNLSKMASDFRLLASGPGSAIGELILPAVQEGSSIMPGKVNPVMCEMLNQVCMKVFGNDHVITHAAESGQLELNAFGPVIMDSLLESFSLLTKGIRLFRERCVTGIKANAARCRAHLKDSLGILTLFTRKFGHHRMSEIYQRHLQTGLPAAQIMIQEGLVTDDEVEAIMNQWTATNNDQQPV